MLLLLTMLTTPSADALPMFGHANGPGLPPPVQQQAQQQHLWPWAGYVPAAHATVVYVPVVVPAAAPLPPPEPTAWQERTVISGGELVALAELEDPSIPLVWE